MAATVFNSSESKQILDRVAAHLTENTIYRRKSDYLAFVCGAADSKPGHQTSARQEFITWASETLPGYRLIKAESVIHQLLYDNSGHINVSELEEHIGNLADCIILFPESPGSFAETGLFSAIDSISAKTLVINCSNHQTQSFLKDGPIATISRRSTYGNPLYIDLTTRPIKFDDVADRLSINRKPRRHSIRDKSFKGMAPQHQFALVHYIFHLFPRLSIEHLKKLIGHTFKPYNQKELRQVVAALQSIGYINVDEKDEDFLMANPDIQTLIEVDGDTFYEAKLEILSRCTRHAQELLSLESPI